MWILFGCFSVVLTILSWLFVLSRNPKAAWTSIAAISCAALTILSEYHLVFGWVNHGDWGALEDVIPSTFHLSAGFVIAMILLNIAAYIVLQKRLSTSAAVQTEL